MATSALRATRSSATLTPHRARAFIAPEIMANIREIEKQIGQEMDELEKLLNM